MFFAFTAASAGSGSISDLLDGKSFDVKIQASGILSLFKPEGKLIFENGTLLLLSGKPVEKFVYDAFEKDGKIFFTASGSTDYDGGVLEWKGVVNGEYLEVVEVDWIRNINASFFHDLLLPDIVKWTINPAQVAKQASGDEMILIPAGTFEMGNPLGAIGDDNYPVHSVTIDGFYMGKFEVTVGQFKAFVKDTGYESSMSFWEGNFVSPEDNHPIVGVDWHTAIAYAQWAGKRLPTEAEWEYAARGGLAGKLYPWGDALDHDNANYHRAWEKGITYDYPDYINTDKKDTWRYSSAPVGSFEPNGFGLYDMAGNVAEWCQDWYQWDFYSVSSMDNPQGPETGTEKVTRGGHWFSWNLGLRVHNRGSNPPDVKGWQDVQGFRLAVDLK